MKKQWSKPELVVLVRSQKEERILETCKTGTAEWHAGPEANHVYCNYNPPYECGDACSSQVAS